MSASDELPFEDEAPATGTAGRVALVGLVAAVALLAVWRLWPDHGRGEREQAHRVLVVGGTPSDLGAVIAEAGFEATQRTWSEAEAEVTALEQRFDVEALIGYADEHGYGFVALMFGDDYPWSRTLLDADAPDSATAAVLSVGELALDGQPRVRFGGPPAELDYARGVSRGEGLRLALYEHPDLLRLWDDPTPEQQAQQIQLGKLADARTLLERASQRYTAALTAWPELPEGAIASPWQRTRGLPVAGGLLVEVRPSSLIVNERRQLERVAGPGRTVLVHAAALADDDPLADAIAVADEPPSWVRVSSDRRWIVGTGSDGRQRRYEVGRDGVSVHDEGWDSRYPLAISNRGELATLDDQVIVTELGDVAFADAHVAAAAWYGPGRLAVGLETTNFDDPALLRRYLLLVRPTAESSQPPARLSFGPDSLVAAETLAPTTARVSNLFATSDGLFVLVEHQTPTSGDARTLVRLRIPVGAELPSSAPEGADSPVLTDALLAASVRAPAQFDAVALGMLPYAEELDVSPDGRWVAWRALGNRRTVRAAAIVDDRLGPAIEIDDGSAGRRLLAPAGPMFSADGRTLVFADAGPTGLSEGDDAGDDPWAAEYLRAVPLPSALK